MLSSSFIESFLQGSSVVFDVRSPSEFTQGHLPGAVNLPLFSDEERALVGTSYVRQSRETAIKLGLEIVGPRSVGLLEEAQDHLQSQKKASIYCWRGGMRSQHVAYLLQLIGIETITLYGGYKSFRHWALQALKVPRKIQLLGGNTGSGKTNTLKDLHESGEQTLDLEHFASHRGSSFGNLGLAEQPSNEQFENLLAMSLRHLSPHHVLWIEDESRMIGNCKVPDPLYNQMQKSTVYLMERSSKERVEILLKIYQEIPAQDMIQATLRLKKKLGGFITQKITQLFTEGNYAKAIALLLDYYDKRYAFSLTKRSSSKTLQIEKKTDQTWLQAILDR